MNNEIISEKQKLDYLLSEIGKVNNLEIKSHLSRYLCVLISGFIENSLKNILNEYVSKRAHPNVSNFTSNKLGHLTNLNEEKIGQLLGFFSDEFREKFKKVLPNESKEAFNAILANRNPIVHGDNVGISFIRVKEYYNNVVKGICLIYILVNQ